MRENALELHGVCKKYGGFALRNVGFTLPRGTVMGLIGENGAGKTTTIKAVLDLIIVMVMTAASGKGCIFSAIPVAIFQGTITALSNLLEDVMNRQALDNLSLVGSVMIFCVGVNLVWGKKFRVANMLPGLVLAVVCAFLPWF